MAEGEQNDPMPGIKQQSYIFGMGPRFGNLSLPLFHRIIIQLNIRDFHEISGRWGANGLANDLVRMYLQYRMRSGTFRYHGWKCNFSISGHYQLLRHCFGSLAASKATITIRKTIHFRLGDFNLNLHTQHHWWGLISQSSSFALRRLVDDH